MDISNSEARREVEIANRILREREADHARELDNIRQAQRDQVDSLVAHQTEGIKRVRDETDAELSSARDGFEKEIHRSSDSFQKTINNDHAEAYDKYGRMANENARDRAKAQELKTKQIQTILDGHDVQTAQERDERKHTIAKLQGKFNEDRLALQKNYEDKAMGSQDSVPGSCQALFLSIAS
ncbi:MAG: hypothetical protein HY074_00390 [Deltaproteobacteria bacterium]|nr:hypothetical protein [Deltaproteobacteria bacterium]